MKSLQILALSLIIGLFSVGRSYSEPIKISQYNEVTVPVICHNKEAFLEVINIFSEIGYEEGIAAYRLNFRMQICYRRPGGYDFKPDKLTVQIDATEWTVEGAIFEGQVEKYDNTFETMYAWVPKSQLKGMRKGDDV